MFINQYKMENEIIQVNINLKKLKYTKMENMLKFVATDFLTENSPKRVFSSKTNP